jgi:Spy/CpxP family protein refolding chaperone
MAILRSFRQGEIVMRRRLFQTAALAALLALPAAAGLAQTTNAPQTQDQTQPPFGRRAGRIGRRGPADNPMRGERGERRLLRDLNLTDEQRRQLRDIEARYAQTLRPEREELRKLVETRRGGGTLTTEQQARAEQLREEMRADAGRMRAEIQNVLTPEQRQQIQQRRDELKQRGEQFRQNREQLRRQRQNGNPPPAGNSNSER